MAEQVVGFYESTAKRILNRLGSGNEQIFQEWQRGRGGGGASVKFFRLQEDAATTRKDIYAFELEDDGTLLTEYTPIYDRFNWLAVARASQDVMAVWDSIKGRWCYVPGSCITFNSSNNQAAAITSTYTPSGGDPQDAPDGVVGTAYSHVVTTAFIVSSPAPTVTGLPPGVSSSWSSPNLTLSGTPTTAGTYYVKIVASASGSGIAGTRTRIVKIVVTA